jgi:hypothetical protein
MFDSLSPEMSYRFSDRLIAIRGRKYDR